MKYLKIMMLALMALFINSAWAVPAVDSADNKNNKKDEEVDWIAILGDGIIGANRSIDCPFQGVLQGQTLFLTGNCMVNDATVTVTDGTGATIHESTVDFVPGLTHTIALPSASGACQILITTAEGLYVLGTFSL